MTWKTAGMSVIAAAMVLYAGCSAPPAAPPGAPATEATAEETATATATAVSTPRTSCLVITASGPQLIDPCDGTTTQYTLGMRDDACRDIVRFEGDKAYANVSDDKLLGWTIGVNFEATLDGRPLGCLRLYFRDKDLEIYRPIDDGGILVDTCAINGNLPIVDGEARFCDDYETKAVTCGINLAKWVDSSDLKNYVASVTQFDPPSIEDALINFVPASTDPIQQYASMSLIGDVRWERNCDLITRAMPLVAYEAQASSSPQPELSLTTNFTSTLIGFQEQCDGSTPTWKPEPVRQYVAHDLHQDAAGVPPFLQYVHQPSVTAPDIETCRVPSGDAPIQLWVGDAVLWIGSSPNAGQNEGFLGNVEGVLVDPFDSKPPMKSPSD